MSNHAEREEKILDFWKKNDIFRKSLEKNEKSGEPFIFFEGPPTANGHPGIHHLEARAFKDAIPRYKTMRGFYVRRKGGWDTHGLPVEIQVEKKLGLKSKKEIESYGIGKFNEQCKDSVWEFVHEWEAFTNRMGYWVDLKRPYITYQSKYIESLWHIMKKVADDGLLYKDYKVVPWCPRCGTALSSHELAQGYETVKDLSLYVKFRSVTDKNLYFLAWTTTPWTLPGNVALAVGKDIEYVEIKTGEDRLIVAKERLSVLGEQKYEISRTMKGSELIGQKYEPLYPFVIDNAINEEKEKIKNAFKIYEADFVTTTDGTGIVHTAVMYGQDDFELGTKVGLPKYHVVNEDGTFKKDTGFLAHKFVKDTETDVMIIKDLASRSLLFAKEKYEHSYPFCWRCHTALIYFARDSWYIRMSQLQKKLLSENEKINWEPEHIKHGRFGEWLADVKDWAISRERYWGTPLPVWLCEKCDDKKIIGSVADIAKKSNNRYWVMRHGEAENNVSRVYDCELNSKYKLTEKGQSQVLESSKAVKKLAIDLVFVSPLARTKETANIVKEALKLNDDQVIFDERLRECQYGIYNGRSDDELSKKSEILDRYTWRPEGGENYLDIKRRMGEFLYDIDQKYAGKNILVITHETPAMLLSAAAAGLDTSETKDIRASGDFLHNAEWREVPFVILPHNQNYETDLHRPYIDEVTFECSCGGKMYRTKEVMDVWFDSGSMPFAEDHYPFENKSYIDKKGYPADFISEGIDQTRGWFYTLHAVGVLMGKGRAYNNVICLGHLLDAEGKKMSKSLGNIVDPMELMNKYGADALRFWMYSVNQAGDAKYFEEKTVDEVVKKVFNLVLNVVSFFDLYGKNIDWKKSYDESKNVLDIWILSRLAELNKDVTEGLDNYRFFEPSRAIRDFVADLSQWYVRRSRDRMKSDDESKRIEALSTLRKVLLDLAKIMAPFAPFIAEDIYQQLHGQKESVHLEEWPNLGAINKVVIDEMAIVREVCSKGLEARMVAKINVRQPLSTIKINLGINKKQKTLSEDLTNVIREELNVKEVLFDDSLQTAVWLDTNIDDHLRKEGQYRELLRIVQDMRKEKGLSPGERARLIVNNESDVSEIIKDFGESLKKLTSLDSIDFATVEQGKEFDIDGKKVLLALA